MCLARVYAFMPLDEPTMHWISQHNQQGCDQSLYTEHVQTVASSRRKQHARKVHSTAILHERHDRPRVKLPTYLPRGLEEIKADKRVEFAVETRLSAKRNWQIMWSERTTNIPSSSGGVFDPRCEFNCEAEARRRLWLALGNSRQSSDRLSGLVER